MRALCAGGYLCLAAASGAQAQEAEGTIFGGVAHSADGFTPSFSDYLSLYAVGSTPAKHLGSVSASGAVSWGLQVQTTPALLSPSLGVNYQPTPSAPSWISSGWSIAVGMNLSLPARRAESTTWAGRDVLLVSGGGVDGVFERPVGSSGSYTLMSKSPGLATATELPGQRWVVWSNGVATELEPRLGSATSPRSWRPVLQRDLHCNVIRYVWDGDRIDEVWFGGNLTSPEDPSCDGGSSSGALVHGTVSGTIGLTLGEDYPHTGSVRFVYSDSPGYDEQAEYGASPPPDTYRLSFAEGTEEVFDARLETIEVWSGRVVDAQHTLWISYDLHYETRNDAPQLASIDRVPSDGGPSAPVARFTYSTHNFELGPAEPFLAELGSTDTIRRDHRRSGRTHDTPFGSASIMSRRLMVDANRDGMLDLLTSDWPSNDAHVIHPDYASRLAWYADPLATGPAGAATSFVASQVTLDSAWRPMGLQSLESRLNIHPDASFEIRESVNISADRTATFARRLVLDLNGDGLLDVVEAESAPAPYDHGLTGWDDRPIAATSPTRLSDPAATWWLSWGRPGGGLDLPEPMDDVPFAFPGASTRWTSCDLTGLDSMHDAAALDFLSVGEIEQLNAQNATTGEVLRLMDINGDGAQDLVYRGADGWDPGGTTSTEIYFWDPVYGQYPLVADVQIPAESTLTEATALGFFLSDPAWTERVLSLPWLWTHIQRESRSTLNRQPNCQFTESRKMRDLVDLNGDGLIDFVVIVPESVVLGGIALPPGWLPGQWRIFYGNGTGFEPQAEVWDAPTEVPRWLSRTLESQAAPTWPPLRHAPDLFPPHVDVPRLLEDVSLSQIDVAEVLDSLLEDMEETGLGPCVEAMSTGLPECTDVEVLALWGEDPDLPEEGISEECETASSAACYSPDHVRMALWVVATMNEDWLGWTSDLDGILGDSLDPLPGEILLNRRYQAGDGLELAFQVDGLLDVDGDGLLDLVHAAVENVEAVYLPGVTWNTDAVAWHRNSGSGFLHNECSSGPTPNTPLRIGSCPEVELLEGGLYASATVINQGSACPPGEACASTVHSPHGAGSALRTLTQYAYTDRRIVRDVNGDGALDVVDTYPEPGGTDELEVMISYGRYSPPGLLVGVDNGQGGSTDFAYRPKASVAPRGTAAMADSTARGHLARSTISEDDITLAAARTTYDYEGESCLDGTCWGFAHTEVRTWEPSLTYTGGSTFHVLPGAWLARSLVETTYDLHPLGALPVQLELHTNPSLPSVPDLGGAPSTTSLALRARVDTTWSHPTTATACDPTHPGPCRITQRVVSTYTEAADASFLAAPVTTTVDYQWTADGLLGEVLRTTDPISHTDEPTGTA